MQTMSNYPGVVRRALVSAGAVIGLVAALTTAAAAAPDASVTIAERTAASTARTAVGLAAVRHTARAPRMMADVQPSAFILETAAWRLRQSTVTGAPGKSRGKQKVARRRTVPLADKTGLPARAQRVARGLAGRGRAERSIYI